MRSSLFVIEFVQPNGRMLSIKIDKTLNKSRNIQATIYSFIREYRLGNKLSCHRIEFPRNNLAIKRICNIQTFLLDQSQISHILQIIWLDISKISFTGNNSFNDRANTRLT